MIQPIFSTQVMSMYNVRGDLVNLSKFIIDNRTNISQMDKARNILSSIPSINSPITNLFNMFSNKLLNENMIVTFIDTSKAITPNIPNITTISFFNPDLKAIRYVDDTAIAPIAIFPEYKDRILFNIYAMWNDNRGVISDHSMLTHRLVRDMFSRSYVEHLYSKKHDMWLGNDIVKDLAYLYGKVISTMFAKMFDLTQERVNILAIILVMYFVQMCTNEGEVFHRQFTDIAQLREIIDIEKAIFDINNGRLPSNIDELEIVIKELVNKSFDMDVFFRVTRMLNTDNILSSISTEYPPYWLYSVVSTVSKENRSRLENIMLGHSTLKRIAVDVTKKVTDGRRFEYMFKR